MKIAEGTSEGFKSSPNSTFSLNATPFVDYILAPWFQVFGLSGASGLLGVSGLLRVSGLLGGSGLLGLFGGMGLIGGSGIGRRG